jgi:DNA-directed RNA polymerase subunit RPC12/RpoP
LEVIVTQENELELEIVCCDCGRRFKRFADLLVWHIPEQLIKELKLKQQPHLKCPYCRGNRFLISVLKDAYGTYPRDAIEKRPD